MGYQIDEIKVRDYDHLVSNGLITNETTIATDPDLVRRMNQAILRGITDTIDNPDEAYQICLKYVEGLDQADQAIQKEVLASSIEFWKAEQLGYSDPVAWQNTQQVLLDMGFLTNPVELMEAFSNDFLVDK
jgi:NitT/TauT family transport system substrate-binding protein